MYFAISLRMSVETKKNTYRSNIYKQILDFFFPRICIACEKQYTDTESAICIHCLWNLPRTNPQIDGILDSRFWGKLEIEGVHSFLKFSKKGKVQKILHALKYKNQPELASFLGKIYAQELENESFVHQVDYLLPVPLHIKRQKERGYNQAREFAEGLGKVLQKPVLNDIVERQVNTLSQTKTKSRFGRFKNLEKAFQIIDNELVNNKSIAIIDDVLTTGSTIEVLGNELKKAGAKNLYVITLAAAQYH